MLFNISNHPLSEWSAEQLTEAKRLWGGVEDIPFPQVDPDATTEQVNQLAEQLCELYVQIVERAEAGSAFHIMGELNFTFSIVTLLKQRGCRVYASTSHRQSVVVSEGKMLKSFCFHQFREY